MKSKSDLNDPFSFLSLIIDLTAALPIPLTASKPNLISFFLLTANLALNNGLASHLAGGTHHAKRATGAGFCIYNDLAVAALYLIETEKASRVLIFDCDVHQGDGTASILNSHSNIFTCSIHCKNNFPARKSISNLDVELGDNLNSEQYLTILNETLNNL